jgi:hypothetical protein
MGCSSRLGEEQQTATTVVARGEMEGHQVQNCRRKNRVILCALVLVDRAETGPPSLPQTQVFMIS